MTAAGANLRICVVNWNDRDNPQAGGAEIQLHETFGRLAAAGHRITLLCSGWKGAPARTRMEGIDVHRVGTRYTFAALAYGYWRRHLAGNGDDVLVEDINKVPLFTPLWGAPRVVAMVPHLFGRTVFGELPVPIASAVWLSERPLPLIYRNVPFEVVSHSTRDDLVARGVAREQIVVIYNGVDAGYYTPMPGTRSPRPRFAYLGRLKRYKGVDIVLKAFARVAGPDMTLEIAGTGDHRPVLEQLAASLDLGDRVRFLGFVSEAEKLTLLRRSWALLFASPKEGWGITNLEAAACGTPVIASDSPGLRESVKDGETGYLVPHGDDAAMAARISQLAADITLVERLGAAGRPFAEWFSWERNARDTEAHLRAVCARPPMTRS